MVPKYPVAVIGDDGLAEVHISIDSIARSIEPPDLPSVILIDSNGQAFSLVEVGTAGWLDKMFSLLGAQGRYETVPVAGDVPPAVVKEGKSALANNAGQGPGGG